MKSKPGLSPKPPERPLAPNCDAWHCRPGVVTNDPRLRAPERNDGDVAFRPGASTWNTDDMREGDPIASKAGAPARNAPSTQLPPKPRLLLLPTYTDIPDSCTVSSSSSSPSCSEGGSRELMDVPCGPPLFDPQPKKGGGQGGKQDAPGPSNKDSGPTPAEIYRRSAKMKESTNTTGAALVSCLLTGGDAVSLLELLPPSAVVL